MQIRWKRGAYAKPDNNDNVNYKWCLRRVRACCFATAWESKAGTIEVYNIACMLPWRFFHKTINKDKHKR